MTPVDFLAAAQEANRLARPVTLEGDRVLRPRRAGTATVHSFLRHLRANGVTSVPEPVGVERTTEVLRYIEGDTARLAWEHQKTLDGVRSAARLLRTIHDASRDWRPPADAVWESSTSNVDIDADDLVYCHGDPGPWNFIWRDGNAVALIDWDLLYPGSRLDDIAYALHWFAPMRSDELALTWHHFPGVPDRRARATALLEEYGGLPRHLDLVEVVGARIRKTQEQIRRQAELGHEPHATWLTQGMIDQWEADMTWARAHRDLFVIDE